MVFRQLSRPSARFQVEWPSPLQAVSVSEDIASGVGAFLLRTGHALHPDCQSGTLAGATYYVTRLFDYHRKDANFPLSLLASPLVHDQSADQLVGACLIGGGGTDGLSMGIYDILVDPTYRGNGIGTGMIRRALTILAEHGIPELHLWRSDDSPAAPLYDRLGFKPTGEVE